jgi:hypothetical protein
MTDLPCSGQYLTHIEPCRFTASWNEKMDVFRISIDEGKDLSAEVHLGKRTFKNNSSTIFNRGLIREDGCLLGCCAA